MTAITLTAANGKYVSAEYGGGIDPRVTPGALVLTASRAAAGAFETFQHVDNGDGTVSLQVSDGRYLTAEGGGGSFLRTDATEVGAWEKFRWVVVDGGRALQCWDGAHYLCAEVATEGYPLNATRTQVGAWETFQVTGLEPDLPAPPPRDLLAQVRCTFQGQRLTTRQFGPLGWFPPALGWLDLAEDREGVYDQSASAGDTHVNLTLSGQYREAGQDYADVPGYDYSRDLPRLRARVREAILAGVARGREHGFCVLLMLAGDGNSRLGPDGQPTGEYNDPAGWTYGIEWLVANFDRVWAALQGGAGEDDLTPWVALCLGYDGVVPGVQPPSLVDAAVTHIRAAIGPHRVVGLELSAGYAVYAGDEFNNWATATGQMFDFILLELPIPICAPAQGLFSLPPQPPPSVPPGDPEGLRRNWDQVWQVAGRLVRPYHRPPEQPADDDPHPPFLLHGTPRGTLFVVLWEFDTYGTVRGLDPAITAQRRAYLRALTDDALVG